MWTNFRSAPDRALSVARYRDLADRYDASCRFVGEARRGALRHLQLSPGETVFDVACGTGAMLPALSQCVGPTGHVLGIELSPEMAAIARARVQASVGHQAGGGVALLESAIEEFSTPLLADALLFCYTHDVLQSRGALKNIITHARPRARVVVLGTRFLPWWWAAPLNLWVCVRGWRYHTTYQGFRKPWQMLSTYCPDLRVVGTYHLGTSYLATGHVSGRASG